MSFVNFSNHCSSAWSNKQRMAAQKWGKIIDVPYPDITATCDETVINRLAEDSIEKILSYKPAAVMCQGEFTLTYAVTTMLKRKGVTVVVACSDRKSKETILDDGTTQKQSIFDFVRFRDINKNRIVNLSMCKNIYKSSEKLNIFVYNQQIRYQAIVPCLTISAKLIIICVYKLYPWVWIPKEI